jgi:hypothetical protein
MYWLILNICCAPVVNAAAASNTVAPDFIINDFIVDSFVGVQSLS